MIRQALQKEIEHEGAQTKRVLEKIPIDQFSWKPHRKSKSIGELALHVAQLPAWTSRILTSTEFDIATMNRQVPEIKTADDLVTMSQAAIQQAVSDLEKATDEALAVKWELKKAGHTIFNLPRAVIIRAMAMNHLVHHRGQLTVYLRLLDIPVPGMYGPSADEIAQ